MVKKFLLLSSILFVGLVFFQITPECFADASAQLQQAKDYRKAGLYGQAEAAYKAITTASPGTGDALEAQKELTILYLLSDRSSEADTIVNSLSTDFASNFNLHEVLYYLAGKYERTGGRYEWRKRHERARAVCQQIIEQFPSSSYADKARLDVTKLDIFALIEAGKTTAAAAAIELIADFSGHPDFPRALFKIALKYQAEYRYEEAKSLYQRIAQQYPDNPNAAMASVNVPRLDIYSLIWSGQEAAATAMIDKLIIDFAGRQYLPEVLHNIARRAENGGRYELAKNVYQKVIQHGLGGFYADMAALDVAHMDVAILIESGAEDSTIQAAVDNLAVNFAGHFKLPRVLYKIARKYEDNDRYQQAKNMYQQIIQRLPGNIYASDSVLDMARIDILSLTASGQDAAAQAALDKLVTDFSGHSYLPVAVSSGIAKHYYHKAFQLEGQGLSGQARDYFRRAAAVWETVLSKFSGAGVIPQACSWAGDCYRKLGEYQKSTVCYQKIVSEYPNSRMASNAQFLVGRNYEDMHKSGVISDSEAETKVKAAYQQLLQNYPDCKAARYVQSWLISHGTN